MIEKRLTLHNLNHVYEAILLTALSCTVLQLSGYKRYRINILHLELATKTFIQTVLTKSVAGTLNLHVEIFI